MSVQMIRQTDNKYSTFKMAQTFDLIVYVSL